MKGSFRLFLVAVIALSVLTGASRAAEKAAKSERDQSSPASAAATSKKININSASKAELESLPGVGPAIADSIIAARPFRSVAELKNVKGIGSERFEDLLPRVTTGRMAARERIATGAPGQSTSATASSDKPGAEAQERNRRPLKADSPTATGPATAPSDKPGAEAQERNRRPANAEPDRSVGYPETPGSGSGKPTAEAQEKNRSGTYSSPSERGAIVNLNTAFKEELESLPGIGPVKAQAIIDARPFKSTEDVMKVNGIKEGTYDQIKDRITVQ